MKKVTGSHYMRGMDKCCRSSENSLKLMAFSNKKKKINI